MFTAAGPVTAADIQVPEYLMKARAALATADAKAPLVPDSTDELAFAKNYLLRAEKEFADNLSWGKLKEKAEPDVRYYAGLAQLQAAIVISRAGKIEQEAERGRLEEAVSAVKAKIRVFDDKNAHISSLTAEIARREAEARAESARRDAEAKAESARRDAEMRAAAARHEAAAAELNTQLAASRDAVEQSAKRIASLESELAARSTAVATADQNTVALAAEIQLQKQRAAAAEQKSAALTAELEASRREASRLAADLTALTAAKGALESRSREQIEALNRQKEFVAEVGSLGGVIKPASDNMTVIFVRSALIKGAKNDTLTAEGEKTIVKITELLKKYPEYRVRLRVHGFGQPAKNEDAGATDRMARMVGAAIIEKGAFDPATVEALGAGPAEPLYPKGNSEGNKRVEVTFVRK